jgi:hypothetical protein
MSPPSAYALRRRIDAQSFRIAWDAALDYAVRRLSDAAFSRALNGVSRPVFFKGEQVGERRFFDERLTMFILRYRDPKRYGAWLDDYMVDQHPDGTAILLSKALDRVAQDAFAAEAGDPPPRHPPLATSRIVDEDELEERRRERLEEAERRRDHEEWVLRKRNAEYWASRNDSQEQGG